LAAIRQQLEKLRQRSVLSRPHELHLQKRQMVDEWELRGRSAIWRLLASRRERLASMARATEALSPLNVLARGYSLTKLAQTAEPVRSIKTLHLGDQLETVLRDGSVFSVVQQVAPSPSPGNASPERS
jgi:exodeoxyribonuclease VII large subunit